MGLYDLACAAGPTLGPIVAGFAVVANGWRWAFWEMLWITGFALALLSFSMPEVSLSPPPSSFFLLLSPPSSFRASASLPGPLGKSELRWYKVASTYTHTSTMT
jgi:MFS family permease